MKKTLLKKTKSILKLALLLLLSLSLSYCSKNEPAPKRTINLPTKVTDSDDGLISTYTYNSSNQLTNYKLNGNTSNEPRDYNFIYNADGTLDQLINASDGSILTTYTYNSDKKLIKKEEGQNIFEYTYTGTEVTENYIGGWKQVYRYDSKGNLTELKYYSSGNEGVIKYTYDDKNNVYDQFPFAFRFPESAVNNVKTEQHNNDAPTTNTYEYNADNYPVKRTDDYNVRVYEYKKL